MAVLTVRSMAFSYWKWLARLRSSSNKSAFRHSSYLNKFHSSTSEPNVPSTIVETTKSKTQFFSWSSSLLPLALAVSAGSLAFQTHNIHPSLCEPTNLDSWFVYLVLFVISDLIELNQLNI